MDFLFDTYMEMYFIDQVILYLDCDALGFESSIFGALLHILVVVIIMLDTLFGNVRTTSHPLVVNHNDYFLYEHLLTKGDPSNLL